MTLSLPTVNLPVNVQIHVCK